MHSCTSAISSPAAPPADTAHTTEKGPTPQCWGPKLVEHLQGPKQLEGQAVLTAVKSSGPGTCQTRVRVPAPTLILWASADPGQAFLSSPPSSEGGQEWSRPPMAARTQGDGQSGSTTERLLSPESPLARLPLLTAAPDLLTQGSKPQWGSVKQFFLRRFC